MKKMLSALALSLALASPAAAGTIQVDFTAGPLDSGPGAFGLTSVDTVTGSFQVDDTTLTSAGIFDLSSILTAFNLVTGSKTWAAADIDSSSFQDTIVVGAGLVIENFGFALTGGVGQSVTISSNNTISVNDGQDFIFCNGCVAFTATDVTGVSVVPLPASLAFMMVGLGGLGVTRRMQRRKA